MKFFTPLLRRVDGWDHDVTFEVDDQGLLSAFKSGQPDADATRLSGPVIPGMANTHSHAFQRLMAGLTEWRASERDSFWSWRELMYRYANQVTPAMLRQVATQLYIEMLKSGYTSICEFHYLHHQPGGVPYAPVTAMADALIEAAADSGIELALLPTLYMRGGFDDRAVSTGQRRFCHQLDDFQKLLSQLKALENSRLRVGAACHSLRAVSGDALKELQGFLSAWPQQVPMHLHIAEQTVEVQDSIAALGKRPVDWLLDNVDLHPHWCLIHATHMTDSECQRLAESPAIAGLCPTTEANLGDGIFPFSDYLSYAGSFCIGSDSHISVSPIEELRWLEYAQRLDHQKRNVCATAQMPNCGEWLWNQAVYGGALASGRLSGGLAIGLPADFLVLDETRVPVHVTGPEQVLDALVFAGNTGWIKDVYVHGRQVVQNGHHAGEQQAQRDYQLAMQQLMLAG